MECFGGVGGSEDRPLTGHARELVAFSRLEGEHGPGHEIAHGCGRYHVYLFLSAAAIATGGKGYPLGPPLVR
jgi:hypothetical protein